MATTKHFDPFAQKLQRNSRNRTLAEKAIFADQETLLGHESGSSKAAGTTSSVWSMITIVILSVLLVLSVLTHPHMRRSQDMDKLCSVHTSAYPSPVEDDIEIRWSRQSVNGSFAEQTIYRQPAGPEVDKAWTDLGAYLQPFAIPEDRAEEFGLHPGQVKRIPEQGGGYVAILESTHHLHCLNVMRQGSHFDYDYYRAQALKTRKGVFADSEELQRLHFSHCLDMLRQRLMCTADTNVCGQVWVHDKGKTKPVVFANIDRKCRNYEEITQWAKQHEMLEGQNLVKKRTGDIVYEGYP